LQDVEKSLIIAVRLWQGLNILREKWLLSSIFSPGIFRGR